MSRGVDVSRLTSNPDFAFGIGSATSEAAKNLLFPEDVPVDAAKQELYKKSHSGQGPLCLRALLVAVLTGHRLHCTLQHMNLVSSVVEGIIGRRSALILPHIGLVVWPRCARVVCYPFSATTLSYCYVCVSG